MDKPDKSTTGRSVDIPGLFSAIRERIWLLIVITGCCLVAGILYVVFSAAEYKSKALVLPEINNSTQSELGQLLQNYGGLLGLSFGGSNNLANKQYISPKVYPVIIHSLSFQSAMLQDTIYFAGMDSSMTLLKFFKRQKGGGGEASKSGYSPGIVNHSSLKILDSLQVSSLTLSQMQAIKELRKRIDITFNVGTGVMNITALMPDPVAAAQVCSKTIEKLKGYVKRYHSRKAREVLRYTNKLYHEYRNKFREAQSKLAAFRDKHNNLIAATARSKEKF